jgi:hypothetical protein
MSRVVPSKLRVASGGRDRQHPRFPDKPHLLLLTAEVVVVLRTGLHLGVVREQTLVVGQGIQKRPEVCIIYDLLHTPEIETRRRDHGPNANPLL